MDVNGMRQAIAMCYPESKSWQERVGKMATNQVVAIYSRFQKDDTFHKKSKKRQKEKSEDYHQIDMFEYFDFGA